MVRAPRRLEGHSRWSIMAAAALERWWARRNRCSPLSRPGLSLWARPQQTKVPIAPSNRASAGSQLKICSQLPCAWKRRGGRITPRSLALTHDPDPEYRVGARFRLGKLREKWATERGQSPSIAACRMRSQTHIGSVSSLPGCSRWRATKAPHGGSCGVRALQACRTMSLVSWTSSPQLFAPDGWLVGLRNCHSARQQHQHVSPTTDDRDRDSGSTAER